MKTWALCLSGVVFKVGVFLWHLGVFALLGLAFESLGLFGGLG